MLTLGNGALQNAKLSIAMIHFFTLPLFKFSLPTPSLSHPAGCTNRFGPKRSRLVFWTAPLGPQARTRAPAIIK